MKNKSIFGFKKELNEEERKITFTGSVEVKDRDNEVITIDSLSYDNYMKNPVVLWAHDYTSLPIGKAVKVWKEDKKLMFDVEFATKDINEKADQVYNLYKKGYLNAVSIGFMGDYQVKDNLGVWNNVELLELSGVPVPANQEALVSIRSLAEAGYKDIIKDINKTVEPFKETDVVDEDIEWDSSAADKRITEWASDSDGNIDYSKYKQAFAWYDSENSEVKAGYKLPHHDIIDGNLSVIWKGVASAMGVLLGAMGGVDIPEGEREGVYNHLAKHYAQYNKDVPEFKSVSNEQSIGKDTDVTDYKDVLKYIREYKKVNSHKDNINKEFLSIIKQYKDNFKGDK